MPKQPIITFDLTYTNVAHGRYFVATVHRGDFGPDSYCHHYYRPSRASLLRVNRAQRLLIRALTPAPAVTIEPESSVELSQIVTTELETESFFDAVRADPDMSPERKAKWLALETDREGVSVAERLARR